MSTQYHSSKPLCSKAFYSSSETILVDDDNMSSKNENENTNHDENLTTSGCGNTKNHKSLKINVMRDLKSVKKLKSAFTNSKYGKSFSNFNESPSSSHHNNNLNANTSSTPSITNTNSKVLSNKSANNEMSESYHHQVQQDHKDSYSSSNIKRSQTFSVPTNNYCKNRSNTTSIISNNDLIDSDFNLADNLSPTNSQSSFYNDSRNNYTNLQGISNMSILY